MAWFRGHWRGIVAWGATAAVIAAVVLLFSLYPAPFMKIPQSQAAAGWAQAFGTVAAIGGAY